MGKISIPAAIRTEDFPPEQRDLVEKLAKIINPFMDQMYRLVNGALSSENMLRQISTVDVKIDSAGKVTNSPQMRLNLKSKAVGMHVISSTNLTTPSIYPTTAPHISFTSTAEILTITDITGLQANSNYRLVVEIIGN